MKACKNSTLNGISSKRDSKKSDKEMKVGGIRSDADLPLPEIQIQMQTIEIEIQLRQHSKKSDKEMKVGGSSSDADLSQLMSFNQAPRESKAGSLILPMITAVQIQIQIQQKYSSILHVLITFCNRDTCRLSVAVLT